MIDDTSDNPLEKVHNLHNKSNVHTGGKRRRLHCPYRLCKFLLLWVFCFLVRVLKRKRKSLDFVVLLTTALKYFWILLAAPYHCSRRWLFQALEKESLFQLMRFYIAFGRLARANLLISFSWKSSQFSKQNWPRALKIRLTKFKLAHAQVMSMQKFSVWRDLWL